MIGTRKLFTLLSVAAIVVALATPTSARFGHGLPFGHPGPFNHGSRNRLCLQGCEQTERACFQTARTNARACADPHCSSQRQAVQDTCRADYKSDACQSARAALHQCLQPCRDTEKAAIGQCQSATQTCATACKNAPPSQPDPQCLSGCQATLQICRLTAAVAQQSCFASCGVSITAAQQACEADPRGGACQTALQAAQACLQPCTKMQYSDVQKCQQGSLTCRATCANAATPTSQATATPTPTSESAPTETPSPGT